MSNYEYVSPEYADQLHKLAELLCTPQRLAVQSLAKVIPLQRGETATYEPDLIA